MCSEAALKQRLVMGESRYTAVPTPTLSNAAVQLKNKANTNYGGDLQQASHACCTGWPMTIQM